jgi:lysophospholipase L1-like esterase
VGSVTHSLSENETLAKYNEAMTASEDESTSCSVINNKILHSGIEIVHSEKIIDRGSVFQAHAAKIETALQIEAVRKNILEFESVCLASHNIMAYRVHESDGTFPKQSCQDDGEQHAGGKLLRFLHDNEINNTVIFVSRWYGGEHLGTVRFAHILDCANDAISKLFDCHQYSVPVKNKFSALREEEPVAVNGSTNMANGASGKILHAVHIPKTEHETNHVKADKENSNRRTLFISDSTSKYIDKKRLLGNQTVSKAIRGTVSAATTTLQNPQGSKDNIILQVGINDVRHGKSANDIKMEFKELVDVACANYSGSDIYLCSLLPVPKGTVQQNDIIREVNQYIKHLSGHPCVHYIDTYQHFVQADSQLLFDDDYHPSLKGTECVIVPQIRGSVENKKYMPVCHKQPTISFPQPSKLCENKASMNSMMNRNWSNSLPQKSSPSLRNGNPIQANGSYNHNSLQSPEIPVHHTVPQSMHRNVWNGSSQPTEISNHHPMPQPMHRNAWNRSSQSTEISNHHPIPQPMHRNAWNGSSQQTEIPNPYPMPQPIYRNNPWTQYQHIPVYGDVPNMAVPYY